MYSNPASWRRGWAAALSGSILAAVLLSASLATQNGVGVVVDRAGPFAHVFDPDTLQITDSVALPLPTFTFVFDVEIAPDLSEAYIGDNENDQIWIIDLQSNPPSLATGVNPIPLVGGALDLTLTVDGRYLLASSGNGLSTGGTSLAVVDLQTRSQVSSLPFDPLSPIAVEAGPDGSVIIVEIVEAQSSFTNTNVRRFRIDGQGNLTDTGEIIGVGTVPGVQNVIVPYYPHLPFFVNRFLARHTVHVSRPAGQTLGSLLTHGLASVDTVTLDFPSGIDVRFDWLRSIVYVRANERPTSGPAGVGNSQIDGYFFNPLTGRFGPRLVSISLDRQAGTAFGAEQTAVDPIGRKLFVSGLAGGEIRVFDSLTGRSRGTITDPNFGFGVGIDVRRNLRRH